MNRNSSASDPRRTISIAPTAVALTIAGSDPSGGAGLQADLKTFQQLGVYGMSVVTLLTVQNTQAVQRVEVLAPELIDAQLDAVLTDIPPRAIKTGALGNAEVVRAVGARLAHVDCPLIVDPVLVSKHGHSLVTDEVVESYRQHLLPHAWMITPNRFEAERLTGLTLDNPDEVAKSIYLLTQMGCKHVLLKLGNVDDESHHVLSGNEENNLMVVPRLRSNNTHGTGCILSAAITASLALGDPNARQAALFGIHRTHEAICVDTQLGAGIHPAEIRGMQQAPWSDMMINKG